MDLMQLYHVLRCHPCLYAIMFMCKLNVSSSSNTWHHGSLYINGLDFVYECSGEYYYSQQLSEHANGVCHIWWQWWDQHVAEVSMGTTTHLNVYDYSLRTSVQGYGWKFAATRGTKSLHHPTLHHSRGTRPGLKDAGHDRRPSIMRGRDNGRPLLARIRVHEGNA